MVSAQCSTDETRFDMTNANISEVRNIPTSFQRTNLVRAGKLKDEVSLVVTDRLPMREMEGKKRA